MVGPWTYLHRAGNAALRYRKDRRSYAVGALAIRADGASTSSRNEAATTPQRTAHAEYRVLRKAGLGAVLYVSRIRRDGSFGVARPCSSCMSVMHSHKVRRCYYSISDTVYGVIVFDR